MLTDSSIGWLLVGHMALYWISGRLGRVCDGLVGVASFIAPLTYWDYVITGGDFTETYRIVIACTEMEIDTIKQTHVFSGYKSLFFHNLICYQT